MVTCMSSSLAGYLTTEDENMQADAIMTNLKAGVSKMVEIAKGNNSAPTGIRSYIMNIYVFVSMHTEF